MFLSSAPADREDPLLQRRRLTLILVVILALAFATVSLVSYLAARGSLEAALVDRELPLASRVVEAELQRELARPYQMALMMASNTFMRDWLAGGEAAPERMVGYLRDIRDRNGVVSSFLVSEASRTYYHADGVLKRVSPEVPIDQWYFRVRAMREPYELNIDHDSARPNSLVAFLNYRIVDADGRFLGATGVGLGMDHLRARLHELSSLYQKRLYLTDRDGLIRMAGGDGPPQGRIRDLPGLALIADRVLTPGGGNFRYVREDREIFLYVRYLPEVRMYLFVEGGADEAASVRRALYFGIALWLAVVLVTMVLTDLTVRRFRRRLEVMATVDHLTGLMNRQAFEQACLSRLEAARRGGYPVTLVMADLDYFRQINDRYGHSGGDRLLREIAGLLRRETRDDDLICRWGGEEFLFLFDRCDALEAERLAERLRCGLLAHEFRQGGRPLRVTMSMGLATAVPGDTLQRLIERADRALFIAKDVGRNRVQAGN